LTLPAPPETSAPDAGPVLPVPPPRALDLRSLTPDELRARVQAHKAPAYRAEQLFRWLHAAELDTATGLPRSLRDKTNVPKDLREALLAEAPLRPLTLEMHQQSKDGTRKFRFRTVDGRAIESVLIPDADEERDMLTLCISSQVGCALDCQFCATATLGFSRHLSAGEIVEQVTQATAVAGRRPTNIVFMGMGEPLHNLANVTRAFQLLLHPWGAGFSPRRITVSTVGLVSGIEELAKLSPAPNLAVSLNATTDEVRNRIMPVNKRWPIATLLEATRKFPLGHNRRLTFEYVMLAGVNDSDADAVRLPRLLRGLPCKVNLIPWNPFAGPAFERPSDERILSFQQIVRATGLPVYIRTPRGDDIDAACGQLAARPEPGAGESLVKLSARSPARAD
jgi:23S rRNA (adenine2503-C2)-methyltransferase